MWIVDGGVKLVSAFSAEKGENIPFTGNYFQRWIYTYLVLYRVSTMCKTEMLIWRNNQHPRIHSMTIISCCFLLDVFPVPIFLKSRFFHYQLRSVTPGCMIVDIANKNDGEEKVLAGLWHHSNSGFKHKLNTHQSTNPTFSLLIHWPSSVRCIIVQYEHKYLQKQMLWQRFTRNKTQCHDVTHCCFLYLFASSVGLQQKEKCGITLALSFKLKTFYLRESL